MITSIENPFCLFDYLHKYGYWYKILWNLIFTAKYLQKPLFITGLWLHFLLQYISPFREQIEFLHKPNITDKKNACRVDSRNLKKWGISPTSKKKVGELPKKWGNRIALCFRQERNKVKGFPGQGKWDKEL